MAGDADTPNAAEISEMVALATGSGAYGSLWLDEALVVRRRLGSLTDFVAVGAPVTDSLLALHGQDARLAALREAPGSILHLANIVVRTCAGDEPRLRITVHWSQPIAGYVVLLNRVAAGDIRDAALEDQLRKRRIADEALARVNQQLEEFTYIISHDLKEPMRAVRYLGDDIAAALAAAPPDVSIAVEKSAAIVAQSRRMSAMLIDLLEYSRIGREHIEPEDVALAELVADIAAASASRPGIAIIAEGPLPIIRALRVPLDLALRNLVSNGVRHHDRETGRVCVSIIEDSEHWLIAVTDDGPGIPRDWHDDIFQPFRKMDPDRHAESTGIGLALVKRAVESAGGRIAVHSDGPARRGARFELYWPKRAARTRS